MIDITKCGKFDMKKVKEGTKVEMEHTDKKWLAERIAKQHLCENKDYYKLLKKAGL